MAFGHPRFMFLRMLEPQRPIATRSNIIFWTKLLDGCNLDQLGVFKIWTDGQHLKLKTICTVLSDGRPEYGAISRMGSPNVPLATHLHTTLGNSDVSLSVCGIDGFIENDLMVIHPTHYCSELHQK